MLDTRSARFMRAVLAASAAAVLAGCATTQPAIPASYAGPLATLQDSAVARRVASAATPEGAAQ